MNNIEAPESSEQNIKKSIRKTHCQTSDFLMQLFKASSMIVFATSFSVVLLLLLMHAPLNASKYVGVLTVGIHVLLLESMNIKQFRVI